MKKIYFFILFFLFIFRSVNGCRFKTLKLYLKDFRQYPITLKILSAFIPFETDIEKQKFIRGVPRCISFYPDDFRKNFCDLCNCALSSGVDSDVSELKLFLSRFYEDSCDQEFIECFLSEEQDKLKEIVKYYKKNNRKSNKEKKQKVQKVLKIIKKYS